MKTLKAVLIDDEIDSVNLLKLQLEKYCDQIEVMAVFTNPLKALKEIDSLQPDVIFIDIEMPIMNGFDFLLQLNLQKLSVIFVTAFNHYAIKAFKFNAVDYLVKPIETQDLKDSVARLDSKNKLNQAQLGMLQKQMKGDSINKIAVTTQNGISFIELKDILYVEANNNYSKLFLIDSKSFVVSKTLKDLQDVLEESHFLRIHRQYIINLLNVVHFNRTDYIITISNKTELPIARNKKDQFIELFKSL